MSKSWRDIARPIIARVIATTEENDLKKALYDAYPFGQRKYHPYKVWLDEIKVQLKKRRFGEKKNNADPNQLNLF